MLRFFLSCSLFATYGVAFATDLKDCALVKLSTGGALGASSRHFIHALGPAQGGKEAGERAWSLKPEAFGRIGLQAPKTTEASLSTYRGRIHEIELMYDAATFSPIDLENLLSRCAKQVTTRCWVTSRGEHYISASSEKHTGVVLVNKRLSPGHGGIPTLCRREPAMHR